MGTNSFPLEVSFLDMLSSLALKKTAILTLNFLVGAEQLSIPMSTVMASNATMRTKLFYSPTRDL